MSDKYRCTNVALHGLHPIIKSAAELRGMTLSAYIRAVAGETAKIEVNQRTIKVGYAKN